MSVNNQDLINLIQYSYRKQIEYLATLTEEEKSETGEVDKWSAKDVMAHIIFWNADMVEELAGLDYTEKVDSGGNAGPDNADVWQQYAGLVWTEIHDLVDQVQHDLLESLQDLTESQLNEEKRYAWTNGRPLWQRIIFRCFYHPLQHTTELIARRGELQPANDIQEEMAARQMALLDSAGWHGNVIYNLGCYYAITGQLEKALENLGRSFELSPLLKEWASQDSDIDSLRDDPGLIALFK